MKKQLLHLLIVLLTVITVQAQQEPLINQYMFNGLFLNPAYAGSHDYNTLTALYRKQWVGFKGAPSTQFLAFDGQSNNKKVGLGLLFSNDQIGVTHQNDFYGNYAYHLNLGSGGKLSMGIRGGISYYRANLSQLTIWDQDDQVFMNDIPPIVMPNFGTGLYYYQERMYVGLSIPNLISYKPQSVFYLNIKDAPQLIRHYYLTMGYVIDINDALILKPSFLFKYLPNAPYQVDINMNLLIEKIFWVGFSLRPAESLVGLLELQASKNFRVGYSYNYGLNNLQNYNAGSHEVMIAYDFGFKKSAYDNLKVKTPRFF